MKYLGNSRHTINELESIIDELLDDIYTNNETSSLEKILLDYLRSLRDNCSTFKNDKLTGEEIIKNLKNSLNELFKDNNLYLH